MADVLPSVVAPVNVSAAQTALIRVVNDAAQLQLGSTAGVQGYLASQIAVAQERATSLASSNPTAAAVYTDQVSMLQTIQSLCNGVSSDLQAQAIALKPAAGAAATPAAGTVSTGTAVAASVGSAALGAIVSSLIAKVI